MIRNLPINDITDCRKNVHSGNLSINYLCDYFHHIFPLSIQSLYPLKYKVGIKSTIIPKSIVKEKVNKNEFGRKIECSIFCIRNDAVC